VPDSNGIGDYPRRSTPRPPIAHEKKCLLVASFIAPRRSPVRQQDAPGRAPPRLVAMLLARIALGSRDLRHEIAGQERG
jgi:hypothetical protein